jgi:hypothetical protein
MSRLPLALGSPPPPFAGFQDSRHVRLELRPELLVGRLHGLRAGFRLYSSFNYYVGNRPQ